MKRIISFVLCVAMLLTLVAACSANDDKPSGNGGSSIGGNGGGLSSGNASGIGVEMPENTTDEEKIAYAYIENIVSLFNMGNEYAEAGLIFIAEYPYGVAAASICAMRYAVDCLLEMKDAAPPADGRISDWDEIAALGWASPYPYLFEGFVFAAKGEKEAARFCFEKAFINPAASEDDNVLMYILTLDAAQLQALRTALTATEDNILAAYTPVHIAIPRSPYNFSADYLRQQGISALDDPETEGADETDETDEADGPNAALAMLYYRAALSLEPFDGNNYAALAALCIEMEAPEVAIGWLNEGLFIDPDNEALNALLEVMREVLGQ